MSGGKISANLQISRSVYVVFKQICDDKGMKYNRQVEIMMERFIEEHT